MKKSSPSRLSPKAAAQVILRRTTMPLASSLCLVSDPFLQPRDGPNSPIGPEEDLTSLDKRDGSHWELLDCEKHEERQTVKAVCTESGPTSNCGKLFVKRVEETVVEMPDHCGAGRYAVAVSMEIATNQTLPPELVKRLSRRGVTLPRVYDFTFDYDFSPIHRRGESDVRFRIDYSSEPYYWNEIVNSPGEAKRDVHDLHAEVKRDFSGSWPAYLHHKFRQEKSNTPSHKMDELHERWFTKNKRWFSNDVVKWLDKLGEINEEWDIAKHRINASEYRDEQSIPAD